MIPTPILAPNSGLPGPAQAAPPGRIPPDRIPAAAQAFEAAFLAEMLRHAGLAQPRQGFGGGPGEDAFAGMLRGEYAAAIAASGPVGLAPRVEAVLRARATG